MLPRPSWPRTFAPGETAVPAATRFTREVMTAWAAMSVSGSGRARWSGSWPRRWWTCRSRSSGATWAARSPGRGAPEQRAGKKPAAVPGPVEEWGVAFAGQLRTHWARLELPEFAGRTDSESSRREPGRGPNWLGFLADASDLLAGTLNPDMVPAIIAQIVVPRLATWCAVYTWTDGGGPLRLGLPVARRRGDASTSCASELADDPDPGRRRPGGSTAARRLADARDPAARARARPRR